LGGGVGKGGGDESVGMAATRPVLVEVGRFYFVLDEIFTGRRIDLDRARRRNVIGRDRIEEQAEHARIDDVGERRGVASHADEIRRAGENHWFFFSFFL